MKKISVLTLLVFAVILPLSVHGATPITNEISEKYFQNCVAGAKKEGTMTTDTQNRYCACTAMNMQTSMTQEDLLALSKRDEPARLALNKVLIDVNGPCMKYPVHDMLYKKCMTDVRNPRICSCLSNKMGYFMSDISKRMLPELLRENPNLYDPMTPIMESQEFQQTEQKIALSCATNPNQK